MRIVLLANTVEELGGAQRVVRVLGDGLAARGHEVTVAGLMPHDRPHAYPISRAQVRTLATVTAPREIARADARAGLRSLLEEGEPGVIVTAQVWAMEHLLEVPHDGWRVIGQYHSSYEAAARGRDLARVLTAYRDVDAFLALAPEDARRFARHGLAAAGWMPNPVAQWPAASPGTERTITFLGRLAPEKGPRFLLEAWARIAGAHPSWQVRFVGSGPQEGDLREQSADLGIADRLVFEPPVADVTSVLATTGILAMPSLAEGLPLALMEAMAAGLPAVAADCSAGVRMLAQDGAAARLVRRGDAPALAAALDALIVDTTARMRLGAAAREAMEPYRMDVILDRWEALLADVVR